MARPSAGSGPSVKPKGRVCLWCSLSPPVVRPVSLPVEAQHVRHQRGAHAGHVSEEQPHTEGPAPLVQAVTPHVEHDGLDGPGEKS